MFFKIGLDYKPFGCGKCLAFWISLIYLPIFTEVRDLDCVFYSFFSYQIAGIIYRYL